MILSFFETIYDENVPLTHEMELGDFCDLLEDAIQIEATSKTDSCLFNMCEYWDSSSRLEKNIKSISGHILDFDNCQKSWKEVSESLENFYHIVYSSWGHLENGSGCFRIVIPYEEILFSPDEKGTGSLLEYYRNEHQVFRKMLVSKCGNVGLDESKKNAGAMFYMPSKRPCGFFHINEAPFLNNMKMAVSDRYLAVLKENENKSKHRAIKQPCLDVEKVIEKGLRIYANRGKGHHMFRSFGFYLRNHSVPLDLIENVLRQHAHEFGTSEKDRLRNIPDLIRSISR